jgi:hypothetical protein
MKDDETKAHIQQQLTMTSKGGKHSYLDFTVCTTSKYESECTNLKNVHVSIIRWPEKRVGHHRIRIVRTAL